jgi:hypothetical protein
VEEKDPPKSIRIHALSDEAFGQVELDFARGTIDDWEIQRLIDTVRIQRQVLREMFSYFQEEPLRLVVNPDPIRRSTLRQLKCIAGMEDR